MAEAPADTLMTADELLALPDDGRCRHELVQGRLVSVSLASKKSVIVSDRIGRRIGNFVEEHRLGVCGGADAGFRLFDEPDTVRSPDYAFVRADRIPEGAVEHGYWPGAPDLVVEVLSPSNRPAEVMEKVEDYLAAGARLMRIFDPDARAVHIFRPDRVPERLGEHGALSGEDVLPGFVLHLAEIWV